MIVGLEEGVLRDGEGEREGDFEISRWWAEDGEEVCDFVVCGNSGLAELNRGKSALADRVSSAELAWDMTLGEMRFTIFGLPEIGRGSSIRFIEEGLIGGVFVIKGGIAASNFGVVTMGLVVMGSEEEGEEVVEDADRAVVDKDFMGSVFA